jgi:uncharacterized membrane protein YgdD (TMEM256/DUF423 family)
MLANCKRLARGWLLAGALLGALAVALGAFAAHGLEGALPAGRLAWIETGARYQALHAVALLAVALLQGRAAATRGIAIAGTAFVTGGVLFPGGLYLAAIAGWTWLIPVVPVGGAAFLVGWLALAWAALAGAPDGD